MGSTTAGPKLVSTLTLGGGTKAAHTSSLLTPPGGIRASSALRPAGSRHNEDTANLQDQQVSSPPLMDVMAGLQPLPGLGPLLSGAGGGQASTALAAGGLGHDGFGDAEMLMDGSGDDDDDMQQLQAIMQQAVENKNNKAEQKKQKILAEVQERMMKQVAQLQTAINKGNKDAAQCQTAFKSLTQQLEAKAGQIEALRDKFAKDLQGVWGEYEELYGQLEATKAKVVTGAEKNAAALKRKIAQLQTASNEELQAVEKKVARTQTKTSKLRGALMNIFNN